MKNKIFQISLILIGISFTIWIIQLFIERPQDTFSRNIFPVTTSRTNYGGGSIPTPQLGAGEQGGGGYHQIQIPNINTILDKINSSPSERAKSFPPSPQRNKNQIYLVAGGDIMLSRNIGYLNKQQGYDRIFGPENFNPLSSFSNCTSENCMLFFNLESLFHPRDNDIPLGGFDFRAHQHNILVLDQLRQFALTEEVNPRSEKWIPLMLSLANNHTLNGGYEGMELTQDLLHTRGIEQVGLGRSSELAKQIGMMGTEDIRICFQAYSYDGKKDIKIWWGRISRNAINQQQMLADLEEMKNLNCDAKILSLHRGAEYRFSPNQRQRNLARTLIDNGADLILWGHSHIPGEIEKYKGKYILYSLGNFIFDQDRGKRATWPWFDYIYDHTLERRTVPTYIAMLAGLKIQKLKSWTRIHLDQVELSSTTDGEHTPLDTETYQELLKRIDKTKT